MIKLRQIIKQQQQNNIYKTINEQQFITLFKQNCKNIINKHMVIYRGCYSEGDFKLFKGNLKNRISKYIHDGVSDSFYNWYMSNSQV